MIKLLLIIILIIFILKTFFSNKESYSYQTPNNTQLAALSRNDLQIPPGVDLSNINFKTMTDQEYSDLIMKLQQTNERPIIKNLPVF